jgi:hypothetical protein
MFCPRCGHNGTSDQHFCRACGFELNRVAELLQDSDQTSLVSDHTNALLVVHQRKLKLVGSIAVLGTVSLGLLALLAGIVVLMVSGKMPLLAGGAILTFMIGIFVGFICLGLASLKPRLPEPAKQRNSLKENAATSTLVEPVGEQPLLSVTEHTTELLKSHNK